MEKLFRQYKNIKKKAFLPQLPKEEIIEVENEDIGAQAAEKTVLPAVDIGGTMVKFGLIGEDSEHNPLLIIKADKIRTPQNNGKGNSMA